MSYSGMDLHARSSTFMFRDEAGPPVADVEVAGSRFDIAAMIERCKAEKVRVVRSGLWDVEPLAGEDHRARKGRVRLLTNRPLSWKPE